MKPRLLVIGFALVAALIGISPVVTQAAGTQRYVVATGGTNNPTCLHFNPCATIGEALAAAAPGDTINVGAGTYPGQLTITKSVTMRGAGEGKTTITPPASLTLDSFGVTSLIEVGSGANVTMTKLAVAGPAMPGGCGASSTGLIYGVWVVQNATLNLSHAAINNIYNGAFDNNAVGGCQQGVAIRVGSNALATVGHATITNVTIDRFQKGGIVIDGPGSTGDVEVSTITDAPQSTIASNGIQVSRGATATVENNTVSGNECNLPDVCGPDPLSSETQADGILLYQPGKTTLKFNTVTKNDKGIEIIDGVADDVIQQNYVSGSRAGGITIFQGTGLKLSANTLQNNGQYGILLSTDSTGVTLSTVNGNSAFGDSKYDLYADANSTFNTFKNNQCNRAFPSKALWGCH